MKEPQLPENEFARLAELRALKVLDSDAEERFDRFTRLAQRMFGVPIALVSLVDANRQWFKSKQGLDACETPRAISFCGHAILDEAPLVIEDTHHDPRFNDNPLVTSAPNIRFYAGVPVKGPAGHRLGTLCLIDEQPRQLHEDDLESLKDLAAMVTDELSTLRLVMTDDLTGISNRRGFLALAQQALAICERNAQPATYIGIDLNDFKLINDHYGHGAGDDALRAFARALLHTFRDSDVIARLGGDEFGILLTGTPLTEAEICITRLQDNISAYNATAEHEYKLAFSAGLSACTDGFNGLAEAQQVADENMYADKQRSKLA